VVDSFQGMRLLGAFVNQLIAFCSIFRWKKISTAKIRLIHRFSTIGCHKYDGNGPSIVSKQ
jgi:hypothetical protein